MVKKTDIQTHGCELRKIDDNIYEYYYGTLDNHSAWVKIIFENNRWAYYRLGDASKYLSTFSCLQDCVDYAYNDMVSAKL